MKKLFCFFLLVLNLRSFAQTKKCVYADKNIKVEYHTKNGLFDGKYVSHYPNGQKKAEGHFKDNLRVGKWDSWDSTGKLHIEHVCKTDSLKKNTSGFVDHHFLKESDIYLASSIWRNVYKETNPLLFTNPSLFDTLFNEIQKDSLIIYKDEEYTQPINKSMIASKFSDKFEIVAYKIKEADFIDSVCKKSDLRIEGIYPVVRPKNSESEENIGLGWIYYPKARKLFASQKLLDKHYPALTNVDEVFFFRHFSSQIYKEANVYDRSIASYAKSPEEALLEAERIEIGLIEWEHYYWLHAKQFPFEQK